MHILVKIIAKRHKYCSTAIFCQRSSSVFFHLPSSNFLIIQQSVTARNQNTTLEQVGRLSLRLMGHGGETRLTPTLSADLITR